MVFVRSAFLSLCFLVSGFRYFVDRSLCTSSPRVGIQSFGTQRKRTGTVAAIANEGMASTTLRPIAFKPSAPVRSDEGFRNTVIEDSPQVSLRRAPPQRLQPWPTVTSPVSDDFPTPRANTSIPAARNIPTSIHLFKTSREASPTQFPNREQYTSGSN